MRRKLLWVDLALKPDRFYLEELPVSEGEMLIFFSCLRSCWTLFFPPGVRKRKQELKIVCDPDTVQSKVLAFIMLLITWILLIRTKNICSPKTEGVNHSIQGNLKYQRNWRSSWKRAEPYIFQFSLYFMWLLPSSPLPPTPPLAKCCVRLFRTF